MSKTILQGSPSHRLRSLVVLLSSTVGVMLRRAAGKPLVPKWSMQFEAATLFYRRQFNHAFDLNDIEQARRYFDSLVMLADAHPRVRVRPALAGEPLGDWMTPEACRSRMTMLYLHGGGYAFYPQATRHFITMMAQWLNLPIFALDYRLTPEHAHPAQLVDALAAYRYLLDKGVDPERLVVAGDSAGGHLCLMMLAALKKAHLPQPALAIGMSPWTDIGLRGASQFGNDRYDLVQGYQTVLYGQWLSGGSGLSVDELSPMGQDYSDVAPIYLQAGGKEILVDMIRDFAGLARSQGASVRLDVWPQMVHEFHAYGDLLPESRQAISRLRDAIASVDKGATGAAFAFGAIAETELDAWRAMVPAPEQISNRC